MMRTVLAMCMALPRVTGPTADRRRIRNQPTRQRLLDIIQESPGIHASELTREVDESWGTVQYHLGLLRKAELVATVEVGRERRFFPQGVDPTKARLLSLVTHGRRGEIAAFIRDHPGARQVEICKALSVSRKTFRSSVTPLIEEGLLEEQRSLQSNRYFASSALETLDAVGPVDPALA